TLRALAQGAPEVLVVGELVEVVGGVLDVGHRSDLEAAVALQHLEQVAVEVALDVEVAAAELGRLLPLLRDDEERRHHEVLAAREVEGGAHRQVELDVDGAGPGGGSSEGERGAEGEGAERASCVHGGSSCLRVSRTAASAAARAASCPGS